MTPMTLVRVVLDPIAWPLVWLALVLAVVHLVRSLTAKQQGRQGFHAWFAAAGVFLALAFWSRTLSVHGQEQQNIQTWMTCLFMFGAAIGCYGGWRYRRQFAASSR